jgi:hypothetical protein
VTVALVSTILVGDRLGDIVITLPRVVRNHQNHSERDYYQQNSIKVYSCIYIVKPRENSLVTKLMNYSCREKLIRT